MSKQYFFALRNKADGTFYSDVGFVFGDLAAAKVFGQEEAAVQAVELNAYAARVGANRFEEGHVIMPPIGMDLEAVELVLAVSAGAREVPGTSEQVENFTKEIGDLVDANKSLGAQIDGLKADLTFANEERDQHEALQAVQEGLLVTANTRIADLELQVSTLSSEGAKIVSDNVTLTAQVAKLTEEIVLRAELTAEVNKLRDQLAKVTASSAAGAVTQSEVTPS